MYANLTPGTEHEDVEEIIMSEYEEIKKNGVSEEEVNKAKAQLVANMKFRQDGSYMVAGSLNEAIASGDWTLYTRYEEMVSAVTAEDIKSVVERYFLEDLSTVGHFVPKSTGNQGLEEALPARQSLKK